MLKREGPSDKKMCQHLSFIILEILPHMPSNYIQNPLKRDKNSPANYTKLRWCVLDSIDRIVVGSLIGAPLLIQFS